MAPGDIFIWPRSDGLTQPSAPTETAWVQGEVCGGGGGQVSLYAPSHVSNLKVIVQTCFDCLCGRKNDGEGLTGESLLRTCLQL